MSFVIPLIADFDAAERAESDLKSFFGKFPMAAEIIWVIDPRIDSKGETWIAKNEGWPAGLERRVLRNTKRLGRGPSVKTGLDAASGELLCVLSADLSVPLSEVFSALRLFLNDPHQEIDMIVGERSEKKRQGPDTRPRRKVFFDAIEDEKAAVLRDGRTSADPTSPFFVIRASLWKTISSDLRVRSWYYTPAIIAAARGAGGKLLNLAITHSRSGPSRMRWFESLFT